MSLIPSNYTPFSYVDYEVDGVSVLTSTLTFSFPKQFLLLDHLEAWHRSGDVDGEKVWTQLSASQVTFVGTSGSAIATLTGTAPTRAVGEIIRILRRTPDAATTRIVDFAVGSLQKVDLNTQALQNLYVTQEVNDRVQLTLGLESEQEEHWDGRTQRIINVAEPVLGTDAARLQDVLDQVIGSGNLPSVTDADNGSTLVVSSGSWDLQTAAEARTSLGFGTAASRNEGSGVDDIPDIETADARYARQDQNLADLDNLITARTNLGIPTNEPAALRSTTDAGVAPNRVVELDINSRLPVIDARNLDLSNHPLVSGDVGRITALMRLRVGTSGQSFAATPATIDIPVHTPEELLNSGADIVLDTSANTVTLLQGTYIFVASFDWVNIDTTNHSEVIWYLRRGVGGSPSFHHTQPQSSVAPTSGGIAYHTNQTAYRFLTVSAASEVIDFQAEEVSGAASGDPRINFGTVLIAKIGV